MPPLDLSNTVNSYAPQVLSGIEALGSMTQGTAGMLSAMFSRTTFDSNMLGGLDSMKGAFAGLSESAMAAFTSVSQFVTEAANGLALTDKSSFGLTPQGSAMLASYRDSFLKNSSSIISKTATDKNAVLLGAAAVGQWMHNTLEAAKQSEQAEQQADAQKALALAEQAKKEAEAAKIAVTDQERKNNAERDTQKHTVEQQVADMRATERNKAIFGERRYFTG